MALFGGLFDKKNCDICGNEIKLLGNRKLSDGNLCKECAAKLSPWFSERKQSTVAEIREQLDYREANKEAVQNFNVTRTLGQGTKVLLDEDNMKFIVTSSSNFRNSNPDVLDFSQVTGCNIDVQESKSEIRKKLPDGKTESYNPAQYDYSYNIYLTIYVNHPYFNEMKFKVNNNSIEIKNPYVSKDTQPMQHQPEPQQRGPQGQSQQARAAQMHQQANQRPDMNQRPGQHPQHTMAQPQQRGGMQGGMQQRGGMPQGHPMGGSQMRMQAFVPDPQSNYEYQEAENLAYDIKDALTQVREAGREAVYQANQPKQACTCPWCGATTIPDANGCCEYCGGAIEQ